MLKLIFKQLRICLIISNVLKKQCGYNFFTWCKQPQSFCDGRTILFVIQFNIIYNYIDEKKKTT
jgi:hypothetical protein